MSALIADYDTALFDLDGVVYLGDVAVAGAVAGLAELRERGVHVGFVTNNAARPPQTVVDQLVRLGIRADLSDVVTSAQVGAQMLAAELAPGSTVLVAGTSALADEVRAVGLVVVDSAADHPDAVIQGYDPQMTWPRLDQAAIAIQQGARWFATNTDSTRPVEQGLVPGCGAMVDAVGNTVGIRPQVAGKPYPPLLTATVTRLGARRPVFVGDRIDTDIMGAVAVGMDSLFVFSGAHGVQDLAHAGPEGRPTHIGSDLRALLEPARQARVAPDSATCRDQRAVVDAGRVRFTTTPAGLEEELDALWAALQLIWRQPGLDTSALGQLGRLR